MHALGATPAAVVSYGHAENRTIILSVLAEDGEAYSSAGAWRSRGSASDYPHP